VQNTARTEFAYAASTPGEGRHSDSKKESEEERKQSMINPTTPEEEIYYNNGLIRQVEVTFSELEAVITKKSNIVYRAMKLHLKKKPENALSSGTST
jgi:hypothetical protein